MSVRITTTSGRVHYTNDVARALRFAGKYGGTVHRSLFGTWVEVGR